MTNTTETAAQPDIQAATQAAEHAKRLRKTIFQARKAVENARCVIRRAATQIAECDPDSVDLSNFWSAIRSSKSAAELVEDAASFSDRTADCVDQAESAAAFAITFAGRSAQCAEEAVKAADDAVAFITQTTNQRGGKTNG